MSSSFRRQSGVRRLIEFLTIHRLPPELAVRLYRIYGPDAQDALRDDPYLLVDPYYGADFAAVDAFALELELPAEVTAEVQDISLRVFRALGLEVYARMDFIYDGRDFYCLEANTLPGMTPTSHLPQEAKAMGISYPELCMRIIELSLEKYNK